MKMQAVPKNKLLDLQRIISKMPLEVFCMAALPEFGLGWREVAKAVRNARLPMQPSSVARVLCRHVSKALTTEEIDNIVCRLRLKLAATQERTWHVVRLMEPARDESVSATIRAFPERIAHCITRSKNRNMRPEVQTMLLGDLMYISIQLVSGVKEGSVLYLATPPGQGVALTSSLTMVALLKASVEALGYKNYENANLSGRDINSLLRISNRHNAIADQLTSIPEYRPTPVITPSGIDYTNKKYDEDYIDTILGPNPPILTSLDIKTTKPFYDCSQLNKMITVSVSLKSDNVAKTLKSWALKGALKPTSDLFKLFNTIKSNKIVYNREDSD